MLARVKCFVFIFPFYHALQQRVLHVTYSFGEKVSVKQNVLLFLAVFTAY